MFLFMPFPVQLTTVDGPGETREKYAEARTGRIKINITHRHVFQPFFILLISSLTLASRLGSTCISECILSKA